jgi:DNA invertase Pin-like site-specific DNA recombinase
VFSALAEFERDLIRERTMAGFPLRELAARRQPESQSSSPPGGAAAAGGASRVCVQVR